MMPGLEKCRKPNGPILWDPTFELFKTVPSVPSAGPIELDDSDDEAIYLIGKPPPDIMLRYAVLAHYLSRLFVSFLIADRGAKAPRPRPPRGA